MADQVNNGFVVTVHEMPLAKIEPNLARHLAVLNAAAPDSAKFLRQKLFADTMVKGVGNKLAWEDFQSRPRKGVHVMIDANDFGTINKKWGQSTGDEAIKSMGGALSAASRMNKGKLFRVGGDEFRAHFDTPEQAHSFARHARQQLEALPPVQGQHHHSVSIGFGHSPEHSEQAVIYAKNKKKSMNYVPGHAQTHAHSLLQGSAGEVPVSAPPEIPPNMRKPIPPGTSPMSLPSAGEPWAMRKSESITLLNDNPNKPVPVYFLANDEGLSPDGASFLKTEGLETWYGGFTEPRQYGFIPRVVLAKTVHISEEGWVIFEPS